MRSVRLTVAVVVAAVVASACAIPLASPSILLPTESPSAVVEGCLANPIPSLDPESELDGAWSSVAPLLDTGGRALQGRVVAAAVLPPDRIAVFHEGDETLFVYSTGLDTWTTLEPAVPPPLAPGTDAVVAVAADGSVYSFASGPESTWVLRYHPATNAWDPDPVPLMPRGLWVHDAVARADGSILLVGQDSVSNDQAAIFDPASGELSMMSAAGRGLGWAEPGLDQTVMAIGLIIESGLSLPVTCLDLAAGLDRPYGQTPPAEMGGAGVGTGPDGRTYIFGNPSYRAEGQQWVLDHQTATWVTFPPPEVPRTSPLVVSGPDDRLYLIGGTRVPNPVLPAVVESKVEVFQPAN
jgi:hypothetical protein